MLTAATTGAVIVRAVNGRGASGAREEIGRGWTSDNPRAGVPGKYSLLPLQYEVCIFFIPNDFNSIQNQKGYSDHRRTEHNHRRRARP